jgi:hypothetical protein
MPEELEWRRPAAGRDEWSTVRVGAQFWAKFDTWERILLAMGHHVERSGTWWHVPAAAGQVPDATIRAMVDAAQAKFDYDAPAEEPAQGTLF